MGGLLSGLVGFAVGLGPGRIAGFVAWVGAGVGLEGAFAAGLSRPAADDTSPLTPRDSWQRDQAFGFIVGLMLGLSLSVGFGLGNRHVAVSVPGIVWFLVFGVVWGLLFPQTWTVSLAFAQLAMRRHTPARLLLFLEDARHRDVLRTVGPVYQFRHARLQDRLARQATPK